jgi:translocator protein
VRSFFRLLICIAGCELVGLLATPLTISAIPTWYATLNKPSFSPPNWVFGPAWTTLYFLMGVAIFIIWKKGFKNKKAKTALSYFLVQLFFNFLWSVLFFGLRSPLLGLLDIIILLLMIVLTFNAFNKLSKAASYLLIPYLCWVSFATLLNLSVFLLNK